METIPTINCQDFSCISHKFLDASSFLRKNGWVHIDVSDARFTYGRTWGDPVELKKLLEAHPEFRFNTEVHLMVEEPEKQVRDWLESGVKRVIVHIEAILDTRFRKESSDPRKIIKEIFDEAARYGAQVVLASNTETPVGVMQPYLDGFHGFQVLAVRPGPSGQKFLPIVLEKIKFLRHTKPDAIIEVDGGINLEIGKLVKSAGANVLAAGSYIFENKNKKRAYETLLAL